MLYRDVSKKRRSLRVASNGDEANRTCTDLIAVPHLCRIDVSLSDLVSSCGCCWSRVFGLKNGEAGPFSLLVHLLIHIAALSSWITRW